MDICLRRSAHFKINNFFFKPPAMKDSKISILLLLSLSLLLLAFVVLFVWGFSYFRQRIDEKEAGATFVIKDSSAIASNIRDSLQKIYSSTIGKLNDELDSTKRNVDSFQVNMDAKLAEFNNLKEEITLILENRNSSSSDIGTARKKIAELQQKLDEWRSKYAYIDQENRRLNKLLAQINALPPENGNRNTVSRNALPTVTTVADRSAGAVSPVSVNGLVLQAIMQLDEGEQETYRALQTDKLKGSFELKSQGPAGGDEVYVIVLQPDGKVLRQSAWQTGMVETTDGRKIYSCKLHFDNIGGESHRLHFSLSVENYQKGNYVVQLYHKGRMIARATKSLS